MARKKKKAEVNVLSFLDVLINVIGALVAIILSFALISVKNAVVAIEVKGTPPEKDPIYICCYYDNITIHPDRTIVPFDDIDQEGSAYRRLVLDIVAERADFNYLVFAIYPEGIRTFEKARFIATESGVDIGYEPMDAGWELKIITDRDRI